MAAIASIKKTGMKAHFSVSDCSKKGIVEKSAHAKTQNAQKRFYTSVEGGRLHLAADNNYVGSVDSYNNVITKFVANLFGWSTQIEINGKTRHVNKAEYVNWLHHNTAHTDATADTVANFLNVAYLDIKADGTQGKMRNYMSPERSRTLFEKMVHALALNNFEKAANYAGKGANLDDTFWIRDHDKFPAISLTSLTAEVPEDNMLFNATLYTPLLYAAEKNNKAFCDHLESLEANLDAHGQNVIFTRERSEIKHVTDVVKTEVVSYDSKDMRTRLKLKTTVTVQYDDTVQPLKDTSYDKSNGNLIVTTSKQEPAHDRFTRLQERTTYRYQPKPSQS